MGYFLQRRKVVKSKARCAEIVGQGACAFFFIYKVKYTVKTLRYKLLVLSITGGIIFQ